MIPLDNTLVGQPTQLSEGAMHRRSILWGVVSAVGALAGSRAYAASEAPSPPVKPKVV
jgi:hypothetical protein